MKQRNNLSWNSRYIVVEELGKGGNAKVWKVKHKKTSEEYALKQLTATHFKDARPRFRREIRIVAEKSKSIQGILKSYALKTISIFRNIMVKKFSRSIFLKTIPKLILVDLGLFSTRFC